MRVWMYGYYYVCMRVCTMFLCMYIYVCMYDIVCVYMCVCQVCVYVCLSVCACVYMCVCARVEFVGIKFVDIQCPAVRTSHI